MARVLLTGASSFTGYWFAKEMAKAGHELVISFTGAKDSYNVFPRAVRVKELVGNYDARYGLSFGERDFIDLVESEEFDILCLHGAHVGNYKGPDYPLLDAVKKNTLALQEVLKAHRGAVLLTGSYFERGEGGLGDDTLPASEYGLAKSITTDLVKFYCSKFGLPLGHFVVPNPFGPYEEMRYTSYLVSQWLKGESGIVKYPAYIRDNIHVKALSRSYVDFVRSLVQQERGFRHMAPSQYRESQLEFTHRFASHMRDNLGLECGVVVEEQAP